MSNRNPFSRARYTSVDDSVANPDQNSTILSGYSPDAGLQLFSGGDLHAYINNTKVGNLESVTWTISVEVVGNYVMGQRNAIGYATGKRVMVGSMVFSQYDRHAIIYQVFHMNDRGVSTIGNLWNLSPDGVAKAGNASAIISNTGDTSTVQSLGGNKISNSGVTSANAYNAFTGLSPSDYEQQLRDQVKAAAWQVASTRIIAADQIPPFNLTLVGVNKNGVAARCTIFGLQITQETGGYSQNDMGNSVGVSYVALNCSPWEPIAGVGFTPVSSSPSNIQQFSIGQLG